MASKHTHLRVTGMELCEFEVFCCCIVLLQHLRPQLQPLADCQWTQWWKEEALFGVLHCFRGCTPLAVFVGLTCIVCVCAVWDGAVSGCQR